MTKSNDKIPNCPPLRFPEFEDEWKKTTLGEVAEINPSSKDALPETFQYIDLEAVVSGQIVKENIISRECAPSRAQRIVRKGDILYQMVRPYQQNNLFFDKSDKYECVASTGYAQIRTNQQDAKFLYHLLHCPLQLEEVINKCTGTNYPAISALDLATISIALPSLPEQSKIASFLAKIDERIEQQRQIISHLHSLSMGFYQYILNRRKSKWSKVFLRDVMTVRNEKNAQKAEVYSVSVKRGILNQIKHLGRSFAAKDTKHYSLVYYGDLVYTKSPTGQFPFGIVKQSFIEKSIAVSPLYGVYIPQNIHIGRIIHNFFLSAVRASSYLASLVQRGAKNTMNITTEHFLDNQVYLPFDTKEQKNIADLLTKVDERIEIEEALLQQYEMQKRYLLKQMFI